MDPNNKKTFEAKDFFANTKGYEFIVDGTSLGDEQTIMFDEFKIKQRMAEINEKTRTQQASFVGRIHKKLDHPSIEGDERLTVVEEADIEQSLILQGKPGDL